MRKSLTKMIFSLKIFPVIPTKHKELQVEKVKVAFVTTRKEEFTDFVVIGVCFEKAVLSEEQAQQLFHNLKKKNWGEKSKVAVVLRNGSSYAWIETRQPLCPKTIAKMARTFGHILKATGLAESYMVCNMTIDI